MKAGMRYRIFIRVRWCAACAAALAALLCLPAWAEPGEGGGQDKAVSFHAERRDYAPVAGLPQAFVEAHLLKGDPALAERATRKLAEVLPAALASLPGPAQRELRSLRFFLLWGPASPQGGKRSGMRYVRRGEPSAGNGHDPRWEHAIVIYSADNLLYLDDLWSRKALVHEMAHAWHVTHWPDQHPPIRQAWKHAADSGLYQGVADYKGKTIASAYATKNTLEYFAEISAAYFVGINYHPFDRKGLAQYDPVGYRLVEQLWSVR